MHHRRNESATEARRNRQRRKRYAQCKGRTRFEDPADAAKNGEHIYKCPGCQGFHRTGRKVIGLTRAGKRVSGEEL
jgi:hypothetical protein